MSDVDEQIEALASGEAAETEEAQDALREDEGLRTRVLDAVVARVEEALASAGDEAPEGLDDLLLAASTLSVVEPGAAEPLRAAARHTSSAVRELVATWVEGPARGDVLSLLLDDPERDVLRVACRRLGEEPDPNVVDRLLLRAREAAPKDRGDWLVTLGACAALAPERIADVSAELIRDAMGDTAHAAKALSGLVRLASGGVFERAALEAIVDQTEPRKSLRARAALATMDVDRPKHLAAIVDAAVSADEDARAVGGVVLGEMKPELGAGALENALSRTDGLPRSRALAYLASRHDWMPLLGFDRVLAHLDDLSGAVRAAAVDGVARYVAERRGGAPLARLTPEVRARIGALAKDPDAEVREAVTRTLKKLG